MQHLRAVAPVAEPDVLEADVPLDAREFASARAVLHLGLLVHHVHDLVQRGDGGEERVVQLRELLHRVEEVRQVEHEGEQRPDQDLVVEEEVAAEPEDDRDRNRREKVDEREVQAVQDDGLLVRLPVVRFTRWNWRSCWRSRLKDCTTRMPAMSSARVAVTVPASPAPRCRRAWRGSGRSPSRRTRTGGRPASRARAASRG